MYLDTINLVEKREQLKQQVLDAFNEEFATDFTDFEELPTLVGDDLGEVDNERGEQEKLENFKSLWGSELEEIKAIDELEEEIESYSEDNFDNGVTLIEDCDFTDYCEQFCEEVGYIDAKMPLILKNNIDFDGIAKDMKMDYTEVEYEGRTYLFR